MALCPDAWSASNVLQFLILFITNSQHGSIWYPTGAFLCSTTKTSHDYQVSRISKNTTCSNKHKLCISILIGQFINTLQCKSLKTICIRHVLYRLIRVNTNINLHDAKLSCRDIVWATTSQTRACLTVRAAFQRQMMIIFPPTREVTSTVSIKTQDLKGFPAEGGNHEAKNTVEYNQPMQAGS